MNMQRAACALGESKSRLQITTQNTDCPARVMSVQRGMQMLMSTTTVIEGQPVSRYLGVVTGEAIIGANIFRDFFATVRDVVGGRSATYEKALGEARDLALKEMQARAEALGANGVIGIDLDYEVLGQSNGMLMVSVSGTAVVL
jgi:uncharacterized protein YbjQ (UPF0145 family)